MATRTMAARQSDAKTTVAMFASLQERYKRPEWAFMTEVPDGTGASGSRRADAVAYNLFPSKGNVLICFELKASKSDLKRELDDGAKANAVGQFADYFFLVCPEGIVDDSMLLPKTWGVLTFKDGKLRQTKRPEALKPRTMDKVFVAALLQSMLRANDAELSALNNNIDKVVYERTQSQLQRYTKAKEEEWQRTFQHLQQELESVTKWRDAMKRCYAKDYYDVCDPSRGKWKYGKTIDEVIADDNLMRDLADFITLRRELKDDSEYALNTMRARMRELEKVVEGVHELMLRPMEFLAKKEPDGDASAKGDTKDEKQGKERVTTDKNQMSLF